MAITAPMWFHNIETSGSAESSVEQCSKPCVALLNQMVEDRIQRMEYENPQDTG